MSANVDRQQEIQFGVNLNNREPLIAPDYDLAALLSLAGRAEELGFASVWVGDSLFAKPRYEALSLLSAISQRTTRVRLGTACLMSALRNPLLLAIEWATLDHLANGRTIFGACIGSAQAGIKHEYEALGLPFEDRATLFEEGLAVLRQAWTEGAVDFHGNHCDYRGVAFDSGTEMGPLTPVQKPPPVWIVSTPRLIDESHDERMRQTIQRDCRRIIEHGDGLMTCCRAQHPEELSEQVQYLEQAAQEQGRDVADYEITYQVTMNIAESTNEARRTFDEYISKYYPEISATVDLANWGPIGDAEYIISWIREFADRGVTHFICRFAGVDQFAQVEQFAKEVLPAFQVETAK